MEHINNLELKNEIQKFEIWWNSSSVSQVYPEGKDLAFITWFNCKANA